MNRKLLLIPLCAGLAAPTMAWAGPPASGPDTVEPPPAGGEMGDADANADPGSAPTLVQEGPAREFLWLFLPGLRYEPVPHKLVLYQGEQLSLHIRPLSLRGDPAHPMHLDAGMVREIRQPVGVRPGLARMPGDAGAGADSDQPDTAGGAFEVTLALGQAGRRSGPRPTLSFFVSTEMHEVAGARSPAGDAARAPISGAGFIGFALRF